jgi:alanine racemase
MTGAEVVAGGERVPVVGTVSMDAIAVRLSGPAPRGTPVTLVGDGVTLEDHARVAETIAYELACGIRVAEGRSRRVLADD